MLTHESRSPHRPVIAHTMIAAHSDRVRELARRCIALDVAVTTDGAESDAARVAHRALGACVVAWEIADHESERQDVVRLAADERAAMLRETALAIAHAERHAEGLPSGAPEHDVVQALRKFHEAMPDLLTRAAIVRFRRSATRRARIEELGGPAFVLGREARVLLAALESATESIAPCDLVYDPDDGFHATLARGLQACVVVEPGAAGATDLGLGTSPAVPALVGIGEDDLHEIHQQWIHSRAASHPFAHEPIVPRGRFCTGHSGALVRGDLDSTGPIGWADGDEVENLARELRARALAHQAFAPDLGGLADRVESVGRYGRALLGFIEYIPAEAEGERQWLIAP